MKEEVRKILIIAIIAIGLGVFLLQNPDLAESKDPDYPTKPINLYIQFGAGGTMDLAGRAFGSAASKYIGQPFLPINKPGAGGTIASMAVITSKPDGYTLGVGAASSIFVAPFSGEAPYKDLSGFTMIMNFGYYVYPLIVRSDAPWKTWQEFIEWARKNPRAAKIGITGARTVASQGLVLWQVEKRENVEFTYIPLKSSAEVLSATLGGHITLYGSTIDTATMPYIKEGKLRILSYLSNEKAPGYENIPSTQDLYGFSLPNILGIFGPKGLPDYVLVKLDDVFAKAVKDPDFINVMNQMYMSVVYLNRAQMNKYVEETYVKCGEIMKMLKAEEAKEKR